jgi:hypothetical protein
MQIASLRDIKIHRGSIRKFLRLKVINTENGVCIKKIQTPLDIWCRRSESNRHEVALAGF